MKCANCGKPIDPTSEEVLCDACIGRQQVIEAIARDLAKQDNYDFDQLLETTVMGHSKASYRCDAERLFALAYPSGQPMIGILAEDQRLSEYFTKTKLYPDGVNIMRCVFGADEIKALKEAGWVKKVGGK